MALAMWHWTSIYSRGEYCNDWAHSQPHETFLTSVNEELFVILGGWSSGQYKKIFTFNFSVYFFYFVHTYYSYWPYYTSYKTSRLMKRWQLGLHFCNFPEIHLITFYFWRQNNSKQIITNLLGGRGVIIHFLCKAERPGPWTRICCNNSEYRW